MKDPIVEEARSAGQALFDRFDNDMKAVCAYLRERERQSGRKVVSLPPRRPFGWIDPTKKAGRAQDVKARELK